VDTIVAIPASPLKMPRLDAYTTSPRSPHLMKSASWWRRYERACRRFSRQSRKAKAFEHEVRRGRGTLEGHEHEGNSFARKGRLSVGALCHAIAHDA